MRSGCKLIVSLSLLILTFSGITVGALGGTKTPVQLLVIDETHSIQSSLQIELFARALIETGEFRIHALTKIPTERNPEAPYDLAVIVPANVDQVWIVTPDLPSRLPPSLAGAARMVESLAERMYEGDRSLDRRAVVGVTNDLFPAVYSGFLVRNGWL